MELCFSEVFSCAIFGIKANDYCKYSLHVEISHSMFASDIKYDKFNLPKYLRSSLLFAASHEQKTDIIIEKNIKQEGISSQINSLLFSELQKPIYE